MKYNMALEDKLERGPRSGNSILIDSILSQDETKDIVSMMIMAEEYTDYNRLPSFCTSSQTGGRDPTRRPKSPPLSPLSLPKVTAQGTWQGSNMSEVGRDSDKMTTDGRKTEMQVVQTLNLRNSFDVLSIMDAEGDYASYKEVGNLPNLATSRNGENDVERASSIVEGDLNGDGAIDTDLVAKAGNLDTTIRDGDIKVDDMNGDGGGGGGDGGADSDDEEKGGQGEGDGDKGAAERGDYLEMFAKLESVDSVIGKMDKRSVLLNKAVQSLIDSLQFSQSEIVDLKKENAALKKRMDDLETEDKRAQYQVNLADEKIDRIETFTKKKNLILEGIPEVQGGKEIVEKTMCTMFDQLAVNNGINFEACYRVGPFNKHRTRPILVTFEKQSDRDMIYAKRMDLKRTADFQRVWINEDLGAISKRKRGLIRLISKEAQSQGIDCRTGKYALHIDDEKYDGDNLDDLPPKLHPTYLKQMQIDESTIAYQSEFAPFSNFFSCQFVCGSHKFFCLEQAFQFVKAKTMNRPLTATRIYLSRDVRLIKKMGDEMGTSEAWEGRKFDVMYQCLKRKFEQNDDLKTLLLKTGNMELVEATPDRLWGCGATLSSNVLRRHTWPGKNKHGEILMTLREEFRRKEKI